MAGDVVGRGGEDGEAAGHRAGERILVGDVGDQGGDVRVAGQPRQLRLGAVDHQDAVVARVGEHLRDRLADLAGADDHDRLHRESPLFRRG